MFLCVDDCDRRFGGQSCRKAMGERKTENDDDDAGRGTGEGRAGCLFSCLAVFLQRRRKGPVGE